MSRSLSDGPVTDQEIRHWRAKAMRFVKEHKDYKFEREDPFADRKKLAKNIYDQLRQYKLPDGKPLFPDAEQVADKLAKYDEPVLIVGKEGQPLKAPPPELLDPEIAAMADMGKPDEPKPEPEPEPEKQAAPKKKPGEVKGAGASA